MDLDRDEISATIRPLREAGFALHWLHQRSKRPIGEDWAEKPVATLAQLLASAGQGNNLGVRLGEYSRVAGYYLHVLDLDIRVPAEAAAARARLAEILPMVDLATFPIVVSGSGGDSRHIYFLTDRPFRKKKLAHSGKKISVTDTKTGKTRRSWTWEIDLFGTGVHVAMPPSIHPDSGKPYRWLREFDFAMLDLGLGPIVPAAAIAALGAPEDDDEDDGETKPALGLTPEQSAAALADLPLADYCDDRDGWLQVGMALHHEYGGSAVGLKLWTDFSRQSEKFDADDIGRVWKSFRTSKTKPVRMATIMQAAAAARIMDMFDEEDEPEAPPPAAPPVPAALDEFDDLLGIPTLLPAAPPAAPVGDEFDEAAMSAAAPATSLDWASLLEFNEEGAIKPTLHNLELIVRNDPRLIGLPQLNRFTQETVQRTPPGHKSRRRKNQAKDTRQLDGAMWNVKDMLNGELWSDDRDFAIRSILEAPKTQGGYSLKVSDRDLKASIVLAADANGFHPVQEYLDGVTWDGVPRAEQLFTKYLGSPNDAYTRSVSRLMLVGAVTRIFEPGHKFDFAVILEGLQGKRKSTFISVLGRNWFAELDGDFHDTKQMVELMQGAWIMEIPELSAMNRGDVRSIKAFISRQRDRARLAYAKRAGEFPRQCIFIGSTNDREYLKDDTGGRRFWPMLCSVDEIDTAELERNIDQIWAEAVVMYRAMRAEQPHGTLPLYLVDREAREQAARLQESRRVESADDAIAGQIQAWLTRPVVSGTLDADVDGKGEPRRRDITCLVEIWCEALNGDMRSYNQSVAQMIGRAMKLLPDWYTDGERKIFRDPYGRQRFYTRFGMSRGSAEFASQ